MNQPGQAIPGMVQKWSPFLNVFHGHLELFNWPEPGENSNVLPPEPDIVNTKRTSCPTPPENTFS